MPPLCAHREGGEAPVRDYRRGSENDPPPPGSAACHGPIRPQRISLAPRIDGAVGGSGAEYFNHSCDPNIVAVIRQGHILYLSRRPIQRGEELTFDYHFAKDVPKVPCCCGNTACRGTINLK